MHDIIERVRALIAKAESSPFPAEADAFMAKAQQLISQHAIDQALLVGADPSSIGHDQVPMTGSYTRERAHIWGASARANRCEVLTQTTYRSNRVQELSLIGRKQDRELVHLLATSLEVQAVTRMASIDTSRSPETPVVQRRSFLRGFAVEVDKRLRSANRQHQAETPMRPAARDALALVSDAVDRYLVDTFDISRARRSSARIDGAAFSRGRQAGAVADVGSARIDSHQRGLGQG